MGSPTGGRRRPSERSCRRSRSPTSSSPIGLKPRAASAGARRRSACAYRTGHRGADVAPIVPGRHHIPAGWTATAVIAEPAPVLEQRLVGRHVDERVCPEGTAAALKHVAAARDDKSGPIGRQIGHGVAEPPVTVCSPVATSTSVTWPTPAAAIVPSSITCSAVTGCPVLPTRCPPPS